MDVDDRVHQLSRQLNRQTLEPIDTIFTTAVSRLSATSVSALAWLRQAAYEQPLITLLFACQTGYIIARLGHRRAPG